MTKRDAPHQNTPRPTAEQMAERRRREAARSAEKARKREARQKIIIGAIAMELARRDASLRAEIEARILERDRGLFSENWHDRDGEEGR